MRRNLNCSLKRKKKVLAKRPVRMLLGLPTFGRSGMSIARQVSPELPAVRRFARLVAGSQKSGDAHVVATLEALNADPSSFPSDLPPRPALYKVFLKLWSSAAPQALSGSFNAEPQNAAERNLEAITPLPRQTFLLRTVEGFSVEEIAAILDRSSDAVVDLITQAGR